jgi:hypothetical protein
MQLTQSIIFVFVASSSATMDVLPGAFYKNFSRAVVGKAASQAHVDSPGMMRENVSQAVVSHLAGAANFGNATQFVSKVKLDINHKVYIEGTATLGDGVGDGSLNECRSFAPQHVASPDAPHVKVCGTGIKMTAYLLGECKSYYEHSRVIGKCRSSMPPDTCDSYSPAEDATFGAYQSYKIEQC